MKEPVVGLLLLPLILLILPLVLLSFDWRCFDRFVRDVDFWSISFIYSRGSSASDFGGSWKKPVTLRTFALPIVTWSAIDTLDKLSRFLPSSSYFWDTKSIMLLRDFPSRQLERIFATNSFVVFYFLVKALRRRSQSSNFPSLLALVCSFWIAFIPFQILNAHISVNIRDRAI